MALNILEILGSIDINAMLDRIESRELGELPAEKREQVIPTRRQPIEEDIKAAILVGNFNRAIETLPNRYRHDLHDLVNWERQFGCLKQTNLGDQIRAFAGALHDLAWGRELEGLPPDALLRSFTFTEIVTDKGTFAREGLREIVSAKFDRIMSPASKRAQFPSDERILAAQKAQHARTAAANAGGPGSRDAGCYITPEPR
jgi:hypothetical protein